ncbi:MAG: hypothetical protein QXP20_04000 [Candidatus Bathyarchaeia archaeon]
MYNLYLYDISIMGETGGLEMEMVLDIFTIGMSTVLLGVLGSIYSLKVAYPT